MPEGDTILRTATTLQRWLAGREVTGGMAVLVGDRVESVEAIAKHLMIRFASGRVLHTHMRMTGSWHVYPRGERWQMPARQARAVLECGDRIAVCFNAPVVELMAARDEAIHPVLAGLGPDVLVEPLDLDGILARIDQQPGATEMGDLLLDQRVLSGIGNIWRCETLFVARVHPRRPLSTLDHAAVSSMVRSAAEMMRKGHGSHWVYGRARRPCRRCSTLITAARVGTQARTAYWCPSCQQ